MWRTMVSSSVLRSFIELGVISRRESVMSRLRLSIRSGTL